MATLNKSVPWFNSSEWKNVFELLFSPNSNETLKKQALQILLIWKARCPVLPSAIESTLGLLEIELNTSLHENEQSDRISRLMYSSVIMRFINHALDDAQFKGQTLLQAASMMKIPEWIVNLRHEAAHGHELPSLSLLKNAAFFAMNWLFETYWVPQNDRIENYTIQRCSVEQDLNVLINNFILLSIFCQGRFKIRTFNDIPDEEMKQSLFEFVSERIIKSKVGTHWDMDLSYVTQRVLTEINETVNQSKSDKMEACIAKILVDEESLFMVCEIDFSEANKSKKNQDSLPNWFVSTFEPILTMLHKRSLLSGLIGELFQIVDDDKEEAKRCLRASQWIREICLGLNKSQLFIPLANEYVKDKKIKKSKENLLSILIQHHPKQQGGLTLDLLSPIPKILTDKTCIFENISKYNTLSQIYIKEYLSLNKTVLGSSTVEEILNLDSIMGLKNQIGTTTATNTIYTVDDLMRECGTESDDTGSMEKTADDVNLREIFKSSRWEIAATDFDWKQCPIGVLPWQLNRIENPSLPSFADL